MPRPLTVLVASDGSPAARAAVSLAGRVPWPDGTRAVGIVAAEMPVAIGHGLPYREALLHSYRSEARRLGLFLRSRFSESHVALVDSHPVDAILAEQRRRRAHVIVVGRGGPGVFGLSLGSVSRRLLREAPCAVLVGKRSSGAIRRVLVAIDGSAASLRGVRLLARLTARAGGQVLLVGVVPPIPMPMMGRMPASVRSDVRRHVAREHAKREVAAGRELDKAAKWLRGAAWKVRTDLRRGTPVVEILKAASTWRADLVVCGARRTRGLNRLLLGSVADGLVSRTQVSVLIAK